MAEDKFGTSDKDFRPDFTGGNNLEDFSDPLSAKSFFQTINHRLFIRVPTINEVGDREIVFSLVGAVYSLHTKIEGVIKSVVLT